VAMLSYGGFESLSHRWRIYALWFLYHYDAVAWGYWGSRNIEGNGWKRWLREPQPPWECLSHRSRASVAVREPQPPRECLSHR